MTTTLYRPRRGSWYWTARPNVDVGRICPSCGEKISRGGEVAFYRRVHGPWTPGEIRHLRCPTEPMLAEQAG